MVIPLQPATNQVEDEESDDEEIICTHLPPTNTGGAQRPPPSNHSSASPPRSSRSGEEDTGFGANDFARTAACATAAGVGVPMAATAGLTAAGFTGSGIAAGSVAAGVQAGIGNVVAGSAFATMQSIGATGGFAILGPVGIGAAIVGGAGYLVTRAWKNSQNQERQNAQRMKEELQRKREEKRRKDEEEKLAKKMLLELNRNRCGGEARGPMCPECRRKLLLKITRKRCGLYKLQKTEPTNGKGNV